MCGTERDANAEIYAVNVDGTVLTRLTEDPAEDAQPAWSPDGAKIAFASNRDGNFEIYVMSADGSDVERLTDDPGNDGFRAWSPDGATIAFSSDRTAATSTR